MKTNKSYSKRLKVTRNGKIIARRSGQNHFNAKNNGSSRMARRRTMAIHMSNKDKARFLNNI